MESLNLINIEPATLGASTGRYDALAFRPFFLLAGISAISLVTFWVAGFVGNLSLNTYYGALGWHRHEMLFGYTVAVIAGFLLTAARNWTGLPTLQGLPLAGFAGLWIAGRVLPLFPGIVPGILIAAIDLAFLPLLALAIAIPVARAKSTRNWAFAPILLVLSIANVLVHLEILEFTESTARIGVFAALDLILLLITLIGGRVIPFFTVRALDGAKPRKHAIIEWASIGSIIAVGLAHAFSIRGIPLAVCAFVAATANGLRLAGWRDRHIWRQPMLWVLHLGYGWLVVGLFLEGLAALDFIGARVPLHAFTAGAIGGLTLGMMARVTLGHTGRPLAAGIATTAAFALVHTAAAALVAALLTGEAYIALVGLAGAFWIASFTLFLWIYAPMLMRPRVDGKPG